MHRITETNSNNYASVDQNSPEVYREHKQNASFASVNLSTDAREKFETDANDANSYISSQTSGEFNSEDVEKSETNPSYYREKYK
ncbi:MAG: hypothetical protein RXQ75_09385 [Acidianus hospitalis]